MDIGREQEKSNRFEKVEMDVSERIEERENDVTGSTSTL